MSMLLQVVVRQRRRLHLHALRVRVRRRTLHVPSKRRQVHHVHRELLQFGNSLSSGIPTFQEHSLPRPETREPALGQRGPPEDNGLRLRQEADGQDVDVVRHSGVSGTGNHSEQRTQQGRRLVGVR